MINREIESKLLEMVKKFPILAITGPRQSGKTTLCKKLFPTYKYVTMENPDSKEFAISDPNGFLEEYAEYVILDEIQNVPELFSYIQGVVDESGKTGQYILTGSQNFLLLEKISQTLAGRIYIYHLLPFSYSELEKTYEQTQLEHIYRGGYPRIYDKNIDPIDFFPSYIQTYLERDVRTIININNLNLFSAFVRLCASRIGQIFNASSISNELGVDYKTIQSWLALLETSFVIYKLKPWHRNFNKRIIKSPKIYFYDTGLACHLLNLKRADDLNTHFAKGNLFENYIINEVIKSNWNKGIHLPLYFWRDRTGNEIDLLIEEGEKVKLVEIKSSKTIKLDFFKRLNYVEKLTTNLIISKYLIYGGDESQKRTQGQVLSWNNTHKL